MEWLPWHHWWWFPLEPLRCRTWTEKMRCGRSIPGSAATKYRVAIFCTTDLSTIKRKKRSNLEVMALSEDFSLPPDVQIHSVVLRIASTGLCMWRACGYTMMFVITFVVAFAAAKGLFFFRSHPHDIGRSALGSRLLGKVANLVSIGQSCLLATTEALPHWLDKASINVNMFVLHPETMANCTIQKTFGQTGELLPAQEAAFRSSTRRS